MIEQGRPNSNAAFKGGDMEFALFGSYENSWHRY